jgi:hypothetical protein
MPITVIARVFFVISGAAVYTELNESGHFDEKSWAGYLGLLTCLVLTQAKQIIAKYGNMPSD